MYIHLHTYIYIYISESNNSLIELHRVWWKNYSILKHYLVEINDNKKCLFSYIRTYFDIYGDILKLYIYIYIYIYMYIYICTYTYIYIYIYIYLCIYMCMHIYIYIYINIYITSEPSPSSNRCVSSFNNLSGLLNISEENIKKLCSKAYSKFIL